MITEGRDEDWAGGGRGLGRHSLTALTAPVRFEGDFIRFRGDNVNLLRFVVRF